MIAVLIDLNPIHYSKFFACIILLDSKPTLGFGKYYFRLTHGKHKAQKGK